MQRTIDETNRRREKQIEYNREHNIIPVTIKKTIDQIMGQTSVLDIKGYDAKAENASVEVMIAAEQEQYNTIPKMEKAIRETKQKMEKAARDMDFMEAARLRDEMFRLQKELESMK